MRKLLTDKILLSYTIEHFSHIILKTCLINQIGKSFLSLTLLWKGKTANFQLKFALNLHIICTKNVLICAFYNAMVLILLTKFVLNCTIRRCSTGIF